VPYYAIGYSNRTDKKYMMEKNSDIINTCQRGQKIDEHTIKWRY